MGIENERERTSSMLDCKDNVPHKPILLNMEKEIINLLVAQRGQDKPNLDVTWHKIDNGWAVAESIESWISY